MRCLPTKNREAAEANYKWGVEKTHRRLDIDVQREDFIGQILRYSDSDNLRMSLPELENNMSLLIFAGSDTCATVLSGTVNYLVKTPHALKSLVHEIRSRYADASEINFSTVQSLPYLVAVVEEGLRLCPPNPSGLQHVVPSGGDTVCGHSLPGGVSGPKSLVIILDTTNLYCSLLRHTYRYTNSLFTAHQKVSISQTFSGQSVGCPMYKQTLHHLSITTISTQYRVLGMDHGAVLERFSAMLNYMSY